MDNLSKILKQSKDRRANDAKRFAEIDHDLCMLCGAYGDDKRTLLVSYFYEIQEVLPEAIDLRDVESRDFDGYYLRTCKSCRADFLSMLKVWRDKRVALRNHPKGHDGDLYFGDVEDLIPVRINGVTVFMDDDEYGIWESKKNNP